MKMKIFVCVLVLLWVLSACTPSESNVPSATTTTASQTTVASTTTTPTVSQSGESTAVPSTASLAIYSRTDMDAVEIIDSGKAGKRCMVTDPAQLDALFGLFANTSGDYLGDTVKGLSGGTLALRLYKQGELIGSVWIAVYGYSEHAYFATDRYREWDTARYYESRYSLTAAQMQEYVKWAGQFSYA